MSARTTARVSRRTDRSHLDNASNTFLSTSQSTVEHMRPLSRLAQLGADYNLDENTKVAPASATTTARSSAPRPSGTFRAMPAASVTGDYDRDRTDSEWQKSNGVCGRSSTASRRKATS